MKTLAWFEFKETIRHRWWLFYSISLFLLSSLILYIGSSESMRANASLLNLVLLLVPLFSLIFGNMCFCESLPFQEILIALSVSRFQIYFGKLVGLFLALSSAFVIGIGFSAWIFWSDIFLLLLIGILLTAIFLSIAFFLSATIDRKELALGTLLIIWLFFFLIYDILIMQIALIFGDYPLEIPMFIMIFLNPIDLARILFTIQLDLSAMMGYSGALFQKYLGGFFGISIGVIALSIWVILPSFFGYIFFQEKDF